MKKGLICISDEVYEHLVYAPLKHHRIATFPGMAERTITIGSAGKTWSVTGWKVGWAIGPAHLIGPMQYTWRNVVGCGVTPVEHAVAGCFQVEINRDFTGLRINFIFKFKINFSIGHPTDNPQSYFNTLRDNELCSNRERMNTILRKLKLSPVIPEAGYFMVADASQYKTFDEITLEDENESWDLACKPLTIPITKNKVY